MVYINLVTPPFPDISYLDSSLRKLYPLGKFFAHEYIGVMCLAEGSFQLLQLSGRKSSAVPFGLFYGHMGQLRSMYIRGSTRAGCYLWCWYVGNWKKKIGCYCSEKINPSTSKPLAKFWYLVNTVMIYGFNTMSMSQFKKDVTPLLTQCITCSWPLAWWVQ